MSIFPIYNDTEPSKTEEDKPGWLENSSFPSHVPLLPEKTTNNPGPSNAVKQDEIISGDENVNIRKKHKKKRRDSHHRVDEETERRRSSNETNSTNSNQFDFVLDTDRDKILRLIPFVPKGNAPKYKKLRYADENARRPFKKRKKIKRFFNVRIGDMDSPNGKNQGSDANREIKLDERQWSSIQQEEDLTKTTALYNRGVNDDPKNVDLWLKYVHFQDSIYQFEKMYKRGSNVKGSRVTADRKLSILDKALAYNPECEILHRERLRIMERVYPADEMSIMLKGLVEKDPGNTILWQGYIEATQCSMAHCNTPAVIEMYNKCLFNLHQLRRTSPVNKIAIEAKILNMLYQCGLFLRQAGLWEQLWTLLSLYLQLNLSPDNHKWFNTTSYEEKELVDLEDVVLKSNLPSHELWLRIEKLREGCHWLPWVEKGPCVDPQRLVLNEDVADLIHPITSTGNSFRMTAIILTLLKIPLLPSRHTTLNDLGLDYVPWALDTVELLLPAFFPISTGENSNYQLLKDLAMFAVGPQYLKSQPGQETYLEFVTTVMRKCARCLNGSEKVAIDLWWFTFERLMIILDREQVLKLTVARKKSLKSTVKQLLQLDDVRNNVLYYREYALLENELGKFDSAIKILSTAAQTKKSGSIFYMTNRTEQAALCSLYRTIVEISLKNSTHKPDNKSRAIGVLTCLALSKPFSLDVQQDNIQEYINAAGIKFNELTVELKADSRDQLPPAEQLLPDFFVDWIACHAWFLYLTQTPWTAAAFLEDTISENIDDFRKEVLYEFYVGILHKHRIDNTSSGSYILLDQILTRAIKFYPNNYYFLSELQQIENVAGCIGRSWWKLTSMLSESNHCIPRLFLVLQASQRMAFIEKAQRQCVLTSGGPYLEDSGSKNRMMAMFQRLTEASSISKHCGLLWRLYLKFLYHRSTADACRNTYYAACEECPWLKALYMDAAIYIPTELPQIQDLLIEKQLRLHLTPEELEILRS